MPRRGVATTRLKADPVAVCDHAGCKLPSQATRERVRQHVAKTGHVARVVVADITYYERDPETAPPSGGAAAIAKLVEDEGLPY